MNFIFALHTCSVMLLSDGTFCEKPAPQMPNVERVSCSCEKRTDLGKRLNLCIECSKQTTIVPNEASCEYMAKNFESSLNRPETGSMLPSLQFERATTCEKKLNVDETSIGGSGKKQQRLPGETIEQFLVRTKGYKMRDKSAPQSKRIPGETPEEYLKRVGL